MLIYFEYLIFFFLYLYETDIIHDIYKKCVYENNYV